MSLAPWLGSRVFPIPQTERMESKPVSLCLGHCWLKGLGFWCVEHCVSPAYVNCRRSCPSSSGQEDWTTFNCFSTCFLLCPLRLREWPSAALRVVGVILPA